jgi:predicted DNA-binding protein with PD1-like motif
MLQEVGSCKIERIVQFRVAVGSDLLFAIEEAVARENISCGVIISGIGALRRAIFRNLKIFPMKFPVSKNDRIYLEITSPMEMVSLGGWIAEGEDGKPKIHAHFSASTVVDESVQTLGGHLTEGTIADIKVVVAIAVLESGGAMTVVDSVSKDIDIIFPKRN